MSCAVCEEASSNYKCPSCRINYCSAACWSKHKSQECEPYKEPEVEGERKTEYYFETEDTVPPEKLELLKKSKKLRKILENKHVRDMLMVVDEVQNATLAMKTAMLEPIFVEFADECLKVVEAETEK